MKDPIADQLAEVASQQRQLQEAIRVILERIEASPGPDVLTKEAACFRLSIGATKLKSMIRLGEIGTCLIGKTEMIPMKEILRLSTPDQPAAVRRSSGRPKKAPKHNGRAEGANVRARLRDLPKRG